MGRPALRYVYPISNVVSFTFIARHHVAWLRRRIPIEVADEPSLDRSGLWAELDHGIPTLLHPILYVLMGDKTSMYWERIHRLELLRSLGGKLGGFDVADSDQLSEKAVDVLNRIDLIVVPSTWAAQAYRDSDVQTPVEVVPHGLSDAFVASNPVSNLAQGDGAMARLLALKRQEGAKLVLFQLVHSGYRKGADIVERVMRRIQAERPDVWLVVKRGVGVDPYLPPLRRLRMVEVAGWLDDLSYVELYDACDVCLCPSRGGGFELPALEAIARGLPTLVPDAGCFKDYTRWVIPVPVARRVRVLPGNPIHVGMGFEVDPDDLYVRLNDVLSHLDEYKRRAEREREGVAQKYSWERVVEGLWMVLKKHEFV